MIGASRSFGVAYCMMVAITISTSLAKQNLVAMIAFTSFRVGIILGPYFGIMASIINTSQADTPY